MRLGLVLVWGSRYLFYSWACINFIASAGGRQAGRLKSSVEIDAGYVLECFRAEWDGDPCETAYKILSTNTYGYYEDIKTIIMVVGQVRREK